jgi:DNA-binding response OmpR family regulator
VLTLHKLDLIGPAGSVRVSTAEAALLCAFSSAEYRRLTIPQITWCLGSAQTSLSKASLQVRIVRLRKKMHAAGAQGAVIEALRNEGYQLFEPVAIQLN